MWEIQPPRLRPWTQLIVIDYLEVSLPRVVVVSPLPSFLTVSDGSISVYGVVEFSV